MARFAIQMSAARRNWHFNDRVHLIYERQWNESHMDLQQNKYMKQISVNRTTDVSIGQQSHLEASITAMTLLLSSMDATIVKTNREQRCALQSTL